MAMPPMFQLSLRVCPWAIFVVAIFARGALGQTVVVNPLPPDALAKFYHQPEGGGILPMAFYPLLEVIDGSSGQPTGQTFAQRMPHYGFLDDAADPLPIGFSTVPLEFIGGLKALSLNCAACHVGELHVPQSGSVKKLRIVGGPNLADFRQFSLDVQASLLRLIVSPGRMARLLVADHRLEPETVAWIEQLPLTPVGEFDYRADNAAGAEFLLRIDEQAAKLRHDTARQLLPRLRRGEQTESMKALNADSQSVAATTSATVAAANAANLDVLRNLQLLIAEAEYFLAQGRYPLTTREGFGRLDAFATVRYLLFPAESTEFPFTGPAGVPHLWGIGRKKWLHWNNNTNSTLQRNIAQSLGTGAVQTPTGINNVLLPNLASLEMIAQQIQPPRWPSAILGALDPTLVARGKVLYQDRCARCHDAGTVDPGSGLTVYRQFTLAEAGTDPNYALNFHLPVGSQSFAEAMGARLSKIERWTYYLRDPLLPIPLTTQLAWSGGAKRLPAVWRDPLKASLDAPVYAALPLAGVWATAPYLHNASVPTLRDLLQPSSRRPVEFMVGHRDYDPDNVGYAQPASLSAVPAINRFDTREAGNSNAGHEGPAFGADDLSPADLEALLEFLKSL